MLKPNDVFSAVMMMCDMVHDIESEQVCRFAHKQYLTPLERELRDTLLDLLAHDFPIMVHEYRNLNRAMDDRACKIVLDQYPCALPLDELGGNQDECFAWRSFDPGSGCLARAGFVTVGVVDG